MHQDKSKVLALHQGVQLLGFRIFLHYKLLKKASIHQVERNLKIWERKYKEGAKYEHITASLSGWLTHAEHGNTFLLRKRIVAEFNMMFAGLHI